MRYRPLLTLAAALLGALGADARHADHAKRAGPSPTPTRINCTTNAECMRVGAPLLRPRLRPTRRDGCSAPVPSSDPKNPPMFVTQPGCPEQAWTVPEKAYYQITAIGAAGGNKGSGRGGFGASISYEFLLNSGDTYTVVAGSRGRDYYPESFGGGGGGLSAVYMGNQLLIIAGGGGGAGYGNKAYSNGYDAPANLFNGSPGTEGGGANGGVRGNFGSGGGGSSAGKSGGAGGAGWLGDGSDNSSPGSGGRSRPSWSGGIFTYYATPSFEIGGFGGGGAPGDYGVSFDCFACSLQRSTRGKQR